MITKGKQYQTRSGRAVTITKFDCAGDFPILGQVEDRNTYDQWTNEGRSNKYIKDPLDLIEVHDTAPPVFKDMCDDDKGALLLANHNDAKIEIFNAFDEWEEKAGGTLFHDCYAYRIAPTRIAGTVDVDADGQPDFRTWKPTFERCVATC